MMIKSLYMAGIIMLLISRAGAQPGLGTVLLRVCDGSKAIKTGKLRVNVLPYTFHSAVAERWMDAPRDSLGGEWIRLPSHVHAFRLVRGNKTMELWMDSLHTNLEQDVYIDRLRWKRGSYTLFAKGCLPEPLTFILPGTPHRVTGYYFRRLRLEPRSLPTH